MRLPGVLLVLFLLHAPVAAPAESWEPPWGAPAPSETAAKPPLESDFDLLRQGVRFFQRYISVVDGDRCPMYPTCSAYALEALQEHGPVLGTFLTVDRLYHETDPEELRHRLHRFDRPRFYDPLTNNDFWLNH